jgi:hypothetical protein
MTLKRYRIKAEIVLELDAENKIEATEKAEYENRRSWESFYIERFTEVAELEDEE